MTALHQLPLALAATLAATAPAQAFRDTFRYPDGNAVPGWTAQTGSFSVLNGQLLLTTGASEWSFLTRDGLSAKNCVLDGEFYYGSGLQFGGLAARHQGGTNPTVTGKIQTGAGTPGFGRLYLYNWPGTSIFADVPNGTFSAFLRLLVVGSQAWLQVDADKNQVYEQTLGPHALTVDAPGRVGVSAYGTTILDNFEFFDAVLRERAGSTPRIGRTYQMDFHSADPGRTYVGMASLTNTGIPLGDRTIPLGADSLLELSLSLGGNLGLVGTTDGNGVGAPRLVLPYQPSLVGLGIYLAVVTLDPTMPGGVRSISNEHHVQVRG
ncbi:MAG: hypothetical protein IT458_05225 [Planctomycetes bacterium]|nr:hypothetical protein [Planctomycetota bacterium]